MKPVILLAFANELVQGRFLKNLSNEQNAIRKALEKAEDNALCELVILSNATIESLTETFQRKKYRDRITVFHYAGHAASYKLLLEGKSGETAEAHSSGLVPFLASQNGLKLVFLNGCNSERQAQDLINAGVPITVGTVEAVNDSIATDLATSFYSAIGEGAGIKQAWDQATYIQQSHKGNRDLGQYYSTRSIELLDEEPDRFPWQIYTRPGSEDILNWNLPEAADNPYFGLPDLSNRFDLPEDPYRFLERYQRKDARVFFGRGAYIRDMHQRLSSPFSAPCLLFYGQSGVGKSSLLEAGLFPRLEADYEIQFIRRDSETGLLAHLKEALGTESNLLDAWKKQEQNSNKKGFILILDQVEEVYTRPRAEEKEELDTFLKEAAQIFSNPQDRPKGKLVLAYRKEYDSEIEKACRKVSLAKEKIFLDRLGRNGIIEVVKGLTSSTALQNKYKVKIEEDLPVVIADDLLVDRDSPISPVLQIIMTRLWQEDLDKAHRNFTVADYNELRQNGILLDDFFHQQMKELHAWEKQHQTNVVSSGLALDILKYHTTQLTTAASRNLEELKTLYSNRKEILEPLLQKMSDLYLLANIDNQKSILAHDTLAPIVRRELNDSDKPGQRALRILQSKGVDYKLDPKGTYIDEADLKIVEDGADGTHAWTEAERALIEKSRQRRDKLEKVRKQRMYLRILAILLIGGLGIIAMIFGFQANRQAKVNAKIAEASRVVRTDATRAYTIISEALEIDPEDKNALQTRRDIYSENEFYKKQILTTDKVNDIQDYWIEDIAFSADEQLIAVAQADKVFLWNNEGKLLKSIPHSDIVTAVQFTENDESIFSVCDNKIAHLWNIDGSPKLNFKGHNDFLVAGHISEDASLIATGGYEGGIYLWNKEGDILDSIPAHDTLINSIYINATNDTLFSSAGNWMKIWHWNGNSTELIDSIYYKAQAISIAYHKQAPYLLVAYRDGTVKFIKSNGEEVREIRAHSKRINKITFSPDGEYFLTGSKDYQAKLWTVEGDLVKTYVGHNNFITALDFDQEGTSFISADAIGRINIWNTYSKAEKILDLQQWGVESTALSPEGDALLIGAGIRAYLQDFDLKYENTAQGFPVWIWDMEAAQPKELEKFEDVVQKVAFAADGQSMIVASRAGYSQLFSRNGQSLGQLNHAGTENIFSAAFLPDYLGWLTIEDDPLSSGVFLWNLQGEVQDSANMALWINDVAVKPGKPSADYFLVGQDFNGTEGYLFYTTTEKIDTVALHDGVLNSIAISRDGTLLSCGESGTRARIWLYDAQNLEPKNHDWNLELFVDNKTGGRGINVMTFSNDNRYLAAGTEGGSVTIFDLELEGQQVQSIDDFGEHNVNGVSFSKDNKWIIVGSSDGYIRFYANLISHEPSFLNKTE